MNYYPFHIADFNLHTSHLTLEEEAVYRRLLDFYYDTESPIPSETQWVIRRLRLGSYSVLVEQILEEFFVKQDDGWHNFRADFEISEYRKRGETARQNGKKGGRPKKNSGLKTQSVSVANPDLTQKKTNHKPITNNHKPNIKGRFTPPSLGEVTEYCRERGNRVNPETFINHYEANGWMRGKNKVKDWKACVRYWEQSDANNKSSSTNYQSKSDRADEALKHHLSQF